MEEEKFITIEEKMLEHVEKKKRRLRNRKIIRTVLILCTLCLIAFYLVSDMSKVKTIIVKGNRYYTDEQILEKAGLDYESSYLLTVRWWVNYQLKKDPLIRSAKLDKDFQSGFTVTIEEERAIGYLAEQPERVLIQGQGIVNIPNLRLDSMPRIGNFDEEQLVQLDKAFLNVDREMLLFISEILPYSESFDENMVMLVMNDGNRVTSSYDGIKLINQYKKILPQLEGTHVCLFMDAYSGSIIKQTGECLLPVSADEETENTE